MNKNTDVEFSIAKQSRSEKTLDDLLDAADHLVTAADPKAFTARSLSEKSGYALGTLVNRLQSVENVFLLVIEKQRDQHIQAIVTLIEEFDKDKPIQELSELLTESAFAAPLIIDAAREIGVFEGSGDLTAQNSRSAKSPYQGWDSLEIYLCHRCNPWSFRARWFGGSRARPSPAGVVKI